MVRQDSEGARRYVERELGLHISDPFIGLVIEKDGKAVGAVILNDYTPGQNIELTAHTCGNWSIADVREIARYCFARVRRITARTSVNNTRAAYMLRALGFKREGVLRHWFDDADAIVFGLLRSEQRIFR
ncbi:GNAT family N-acetyltransferase [Bradyrhizobium sp. Pha-3]|uniref:GNAT family N-acetyltransferase n=1 Tax=Bradyrhizobium sp. Pha-3 TaxID=208375 RepID=UPI0035D428C5